ncbi:uncharacterized protein LOC143363131 [Halictus rubicundus]|uniref:uncharacterized protein LOC143363131 n=1 Tax=Halictus rubicundus TaxID=77578 RepID=UPI00403561B9
MTLTTYGKVKVIGAGSLFVYIYRSPEICSECATNSINLRTVRKIQVQVRKKRTKKVIQDKVKELVNKNIDLRQPRSLKERVNGNWKNWMNEKRLNLKVSGVDCINVETRTYGSTNK